MAEFKADANRLTTADSGPRDVRTVKWLVFHTTENSDSTTPDAVAKWQQNRANQSSYNGLVGVDGRTVRGNSDNYIPWAAMKTGNRYGVHWSCIGYASRTRDQWLAHPKQLDALARLAVHHHIEYGIDLRFLTVAEVKALKVKGLCTHHDISLAFGESDHTDPGKGFPKDEVIKRAKALLEARRLVENPQRTQEVNHVSDPITIDNQIQLRGPNLEGWDRLGHRTVVDSLGALGVAIGEIARAVGREDIAESLNFYDIRGQVKPKK